MDIIKCRKKVYILNASNTLSRILSFDTKSMCITLFDLEYCTFSVHRGAISANDLRDSIECDDMTNSESLRYLIRSGMTNIMDIPSKWFKNNPVEHEMLCNKLHDEIIEFQKDKKRYMERKDNYIFGADGCFVVQLVVDEDLLPIDYTIDFFNKLGISIIPTIVCPTTGRWMLFKIKLSYSKEFLVETCY